MPPQKGPLNLNETILEIVDMTRGELEKNQISLRTELEDNLPIVLGDRVQLQQVLLNLILNAVEAVSAANEGPREVLISSSRDQSDGVVIAIQDTGIGLERSNIDHLFDAFHTTKPGGMGIGLTISRSIIEAHGGSIRATVNGPRGAVFHFTLPGGRGAEV